MPSKKQRNRRINNKNRNGNKTKGKKLKISYKTKKVIKYTFLVILISLLVLVGVFFGKIYGVIKDAKMGIDSFIIKNENSVVKDINGTVIATLSGDENREIISISEMSKYLPKAFVAIEDERFYEHRGVDVKRTAAATVKFGLSKVGIGKSSYGGSTITQQLVKNATKETSRTWDRKVKEMARAYYIENELSKDQILEQYLNLIYLGGNTYGVEVASHYYFNKSAAELTLAECVFLAGINNSPEAYRAFSDEQADKDKIKNRALTVLGKLYELREISQLTITEEEYNTAKEELQNGLKFEKGTIRQNNYSYHTDAAINQIANELMEKNEWTYQFALKYISNSGLTIYSTQDSGIQKQMEEVFEKEKYQVASRETKDENGNYVSSQAAMVLIDHKTGYVLATAGGLGEKIPFGLQRATQSRRSAGSSMKPLSVLVPGIDSGTITAGTVYNDSRTNFGGGYSPRNSHNVYKGNITVRFAIESSQNVPMVKALQQIGIENSLKYLKNMGFAEIDDEKDNNLTIALGAITKGVTPLEMAAAYACIANDGVYIKPTLYTEVRDSNNNLILKANQEQRTVMSSAAAYVVKDILTQPVKGGAGTATNCRISNMSVGAKTGTTDNDYDRWLCGFTPYYTAATWFGYDKKEEVRYNGNPAAAIWIDVMRPIHNTLSSKYFKDSKPEGVVYATICRDSGLLATENCKLDSRGDRSYTEVFVRGTAPRKECISHTPVDICLDSECIANDFCTNRVTRLLTKTNIEKMEVCTLHTTPAVVIDETPKPEEPKPEESKPEEPKPEESKPEEPKPAEPKPPENTTPSENKVVNNVEVGTAP